MNTVKNFIYNISDILIALLIIAVAVLIIGWRVNSIMDYPSRIIATQTEETGSSSSQTDSSSVDSSTSDSASSDAAGGSSTATSTTTVTVVQNSTVDDIAASLVSAGVISDAEQFTSAVEAADAATKLKYGTYTIPAGASMDQIIQMMTS